MNIRRVRIVAAATLTIGLLIAACGSDEPAAKALSGYVLDPAPQVGDVSLPDASNDGADFRFAATDGHFLLVYFGYLSCPDICPTTLAEVRKAIGLLGDDGEKIELAMVTVDPERDTGEMVTKYVQSFVPAAHGLRTDDADALEAAATAFGASYSVVTNDDGSIDVGHSAVTYVVDPTGAVVLSWPYGIKAQPMADDLSILFDELGA